MGRRTSVPLPPVVRELVRLGENIRLARLRRGLTAELVAERAGMARDTLRALENGEAGVSLGALANVLHTLGLSQELSAVASDDEFGRRLQDAQLEQHVVRSKPRRKSPPRGTVDLLDHVGNDVESAVGRRAVVWAASSDWIQTFLPGPPPRERAPEALRVGEEVLVSEVVSSAAPTFLRVGTDAGDRVVMMGDLRLTAEESS